MCWNAEVSLNTFIFSICTLAFVYYNNEYTQYKIKEFNNKWIYIFLVLVFSIQLFEFFIWKNIKNGYNSFFTKILLIVVYFQPIASLMLLSNLTLRNAFLIPYFIFGIYNITKIIQTDTIHSSISKNGHLVWNGYKMSLNGISLTRVYYFLFVFLLLFSFFYEGKFLYLFFGVITLAIFVYKEIKTSASMWCWIVNLISFFMLFYILFFLPFFEKKQLC